MAKIKRADLYQFAQANPERYLSVFGDNDPLGVSTELRERMAPPPLPAPTAGERVGGGLLSLAVGAQRAVKAVPDLVELVAPNPVTGAASDFFQRGIDAAYEVMPQSVQRDLQNQILSRDQDGNLQFSAPNVSQVVDVLAGSAPQIPFLLSGGGLLSKAGQARGLGKGLADAVGFGTANAAAVTGNAYDQTRREALEAGASEADARTAGLKTAAVMAPVSALTGGAGLGLAARLGAGKGVAGGFVRGVAADAPFEAVEEGAESLAQDFGLDRPLNFEQAGSGAILGAIAGGLPGGVVGAVNARQDAMSRALQRAEQARQENASLRGLTQTPLVTPAVPSEAVQTRATELEQQASRLYAERAAEETRRAAAMQPRQLALPAPSGPSPVPFAVSAAGQVARADARATQIADEQRAEADALSGRITGIKVPTAEVRGKDGAPFKSPMQANAARRKMPDAEQFVVKKVAEKEFVLARKPPAAAQPQPTSPQTQIQPQVSPAQEPAKNPPGNSYLQNRDRDRADSMQQIRSIAADPDPARLSFSRTADGAPLVSVANDASTIPDSDFGITDTVKLEGRQNPLPVRYAVVEASDVIASQSFDGTPDPRYGSARTPGEIRALNNGRIIGLAQAYQQGRADRYREGIIQDAKLHGIGPEAIASKRAPVIVRVYQDAENADPNLGRASNTATMLALSPVEQAKNDADRVPLVENELEQVQLFLRTLPQSERAALTTSDGRPAKAAYDRVRSATFWKAYGDERLLANTAEEADPEFKSVLNSLREAAPAFAAMPERQEFDLKRTVSDAVEMLAEARRRGLKMEDFQRQGDFIGRDPNAQAIARYLADNSRSSKRMGAFLTAIAQSVEPDMGTADLLGPREPQKLADVGRRASERMKEQYGQEETGVAFPEGAADGQSGPIPGADEARDRNSEPAGRGRTAPGDAQAGSASDFALRSPEPVAATPTRPTEQQSDFFGRNETAQGILDRQRGQDARRNGTQDVPPDVDGGLFSARQRQTDLADAASANGQPEATDPLPRGLAPAVPGTSQQQGTESRSASPGRPGLIQDSGEKIGGARKDWRERGLTLADLEQMRGGEESDAVVKANIWKPDYEGMIARGAEPSSVALVKGIYDRLAARPKRDTPEERRRYVRMMELVRDAYSDIKTEQDVKTAGLRLKFEKLGLSRGAGNSGTGAEVANRALLFSVYRSRTDPFVLGYGARSRAQELVGSGWPQKTQRVQRRNTEAGDDAVAEPRRPHLDAIQRTGRDIRAGKNVGSDDFRQEFGFRGVEFGNWTAQDERQKLINMAYDALHDMADVLGIPPRAISLNGTLGLALGARGKGRASAHYEQGKLVINMTKIKGAGSLAHEWGHALDHYFGELDKQNAYSGAATGVSGWREKRDYSGKPKMRAVRGEDGKWGNQYRHDLDNLRPEMRDAWNEVMESLFSRNLSQAEAVRQSELSLERLESRLNEAEASGTDGARNALRDLIEDEKKRLASARIGSMIGFQRVKSSYYMESEKLSGKTGDYWKRPTEMLARAFESYVFDKIQQAGNVSEYLVNGVEETRFSGGRYKGNPYPAGEERKTINDAFDKLFSTMQTREENGNVALFSRADQSDAEASPSEADARSGLQLPGDERRPQGDPRMPDIVPEDSEIARLRQRIADLEVELRTDALTGLRNRRAFTEDAGLGWQAVAVFDMDGLKRLNDFVGHEHADKVLKQLAGVLMQAESETTRFYRLGGDEFVARVQTQEEADLLAREVQERLELVDVALEVRQPDGSVRNMVYEGIGVSRGVGATFDEADQAANRNKQARLASGIRDDARGSGPPRRLREAADRRGIGRSLGESQEVGPADADLGPPRPGDALRLNRLNAVLRDLHGEPVELIPVAPADTARGRQMVDVSTAVKRLFDRDVVFFTSDSTLAPNGVYLNGRTLFVNARASVSFQHVIGHELLHSLRAQSPGLYDAARSALLAAARDGALGQYQAKLDRLYDRDGLPRLKAGKVEEEFVADVFGAVLARPETLNEVATRMEAGAFKRLVAQILRLLDQIAAQLTGKRQQEAPDDFAGRMLEDVAAARETVLNALTELAAQTGLSASPLDAPAIKEALAQSRTGTRQADGADYARDDSDIAQADAEYQAVEARYADLLRAHREEGKPLPAPNGQPSKLNERQWVQVRTPRFKQWFGDWEALSHQKFLDGEPVATLTGLEFAPDGVPLTEKVPRWYADHGYATVKLAGVGEVTLDKRAVADSIAHGIGRNKASAFAAVPEVLLKGRIVSAAPLTGSTEGGMTYHVAAPISMDDRGYVVTVLVKADSKSRRMYVHEVVVKEKLQQRAFKTGAVAAETGKQSGANDSAGAIRSILQSIYKVNPETVSKVVDANGEPLVVFHGTLKNVEQFSDDPKHRRFGASRGFYFSESPYHAGTYADTISNASIKWNPQSPFAHEPLQGGNIMQVFLNIRNHETLTARAGMTGEGAVDVQGGKPTLDARAAGFDGIKAVSAGNADPLIKPTVWVAFRPEQIKSAIGNVGTFDPDNADIRFSRASQAERLDDILGRTPQRSPDQDEFAEENRRLREEDRTLLKRAKALYQKWVLPAGLLPESVFDQNRQRVRELKAEDFDVEVRVRGLESAVLADYGKRIDQLSAAQQRMLNEALGGNADASIPERTRTEILAMRGQIDALSAEYADYLQRQVSEIGGDAGLLDTIRRNIGSYVNRSYRAFDDPTWFKQVPTETVNAARRYLMDGYRERGASLAEARRLADVAVNEILKHGTAYESLDRFIREGKLGAKDLSVLMRRKQVPPVIRELLGEYTDPRVNFAKSATKMSRLVFNQRFLDRVRAAGVGVYLFEENTRPANATVQIAGEKSEVYSPLNGLWTTPEVAQAFQDALGAEKLNGIWGHLVRLNGAIKYGKTVLSPTTAARNFQSAMLFSIANGHFDMTRVTDAIRLAQATWGKSENTENNTYIRKLMRLGVVGDGAQSNEVMRLVADSKIEDLLTGKLKKGLGPIKQFNDLAQAFYRFGDDFWKIIGFENEKKLWLEAGLPESQAEERAAQRVIDTYPTYSMQGALVKTLSRLPFIASFPTFTAEMIRTSKNIMKYAAEDIRSDNPAIRQMGYKRLVGIGMVSGLFYALAALSKQALGVDDEEEEAVRELAPPWQKNSTFIYTGRDENGGLKYFDITFLDPYAFAKRPIQALMRDQPWEDGLVSAVGEIVSPFLSEDIAIGVIREVVSNRKSSGGRIYSEQDSVIDQTASIAKHIAKGLQPGITANTIRTLDALNGKISPSGKEYNVGDEAMAWFGWRATTLDPKAALYYRAYEFNDGLQDARSTLGRTLRDLNDVDDGDIQRAVAVATRKHAQAFRDMGRIVLAAERAGLSRPEIITILRSNGVSQANALALAKGTSPPFRLTPQALQSALRAAAGRSSDPEFRPELVRRYRQANSMILSGESP